MNAFDELKKRAENEIEELRKASAETDDANKKLIYRKIKVGIEAMLEHIYEVEEEYKKHTVKTKADKIRSMSDEELAEFIDKTVRQSGDNLFSCSGRLRCDECDKCYLEWLQSEAE